jgi:hypothetical protein
MRGSYATLMGRLGTVDVNRHRSLFLLFPLETRALF